jgi:hypothetical protein
MGRLVAGVVALAVFICGAMYWSQAEQLQTMPSQPLCPGVTCADKAVTPIENAAAVAPAALDTSAGAAGTVNDCAGKSCSDKDCADKGCADSGKKNRGGCPKDKAKQAVDA